MLKKIIKKITKNKEKTEKQRKKMLKTDRKLCYFRDKENISKAEVLEILKTNDNVVLLDVRSNQEYREGNLPRKYKHTIIWNTKKSNNRIKK